MTRSAGDAVIPHSRPGRWCSAGSSVRTPERTRMDQYAQLVLDVLRYAQPVEVGKERSDVVVALRANCQACGRRDHSRLSKLANNIMLYKCFIKMVDYW